MATSTVPNPTTKDNPVAFRASLDATEGVALRDTTDRVFFIDDALGLWTELFNRDMPRLMLYGKLDLIQVQAIRDGDLYQAVDHRNSHRPLQAA